MTQRESTSKKIRVGKVPFEISTMAEAVQRVILAADQSQATSIRLSNAYCVALAARDELYSNLLNNDGLNFPDGTPIVWFMNSTRTTPRSHRVRGPSLFIETIKATADGDYGHFFLGTTPDTLNRLTTRLTLEYPALKVSGCYSPPFAPLTDDLYEQCAREILKTDSKIVWVALGTPKQDFLAEELSKRVGRPCIAVGAAFDFVAGTVKEAPVWVQNSGTEWLYRLIREPRRLWRRYLVGNFQFLWSAATERRK